MRKKNWVHPQKKFNHTDYGFDVLWFAYFTFIDFELNQEKDYKTVLRAPSADKAKDILINKVKRLHPGNKVKSLKTFKIHAKYRVDPRTKRRTLTPEQWEAFRHVAFPNAGDRLHLIEKPRQEGQTNYFNRQLTEEHRKKLLATGFKKGDKNWMRQNPLTDADKPPAEERHLYRPAKRGRRGATWERIPEEERRAQKIDIINALIATDGNRTRAAQLLGRHKKDLWRIMHEKFPEVDWNKDYPIGGRTAPTAEQIQKQKETYQRNKPFRVHWAKGKKMSPDSLAKKRATFDEQRRLRLEKMKPKIIKALRDNGNVRAAAAKALNISRHCLWDNMRSIKDVDWEKDFPSESKFSNHTTRSSRSGKYLKNEAL